MAFLSESTGRVKGVGGDVDLFWGDEGSSSMLLSWLFWVNCLRGK